MINYNEIRPGNYLLIENHPQKVLFIKPNDYSTNLNDEPFIVVFEHHEYKTSYELYSNEVVNYLQINNDILKKLGFIWLDDGDPYCYTSDYNLRIDEKGYVVWHDLFLHDVQIKYVHELQNLYYSLSKKELTWVEN